MARLCPRQQAARHDPGRDRVPAPILPPRASPRLRAHPPLRPALQPLPPTAAAPGSPTARRSRPTAASTTTTARPRPMALPPMRQSHARRPAIHRCTTVPREIGFFLTASPNPHSWPAPRSSCPQCATRIENHFPAILNSLSQALIRTAFAPPLTLSPHQGRQSLTKKHTEDHQTPSIPHNSHQYHRDHGACGFLLVS